MSNPIAGTNIPIPEGYFDGAGNIVNEGGSRPTLVQLLNSRATVTTGELHVYADGTSGDDANDGLSAATPKKTLQAAFDLVPNFINHWTTLHASGTFEEADGRLTISARNLQSSLIITGDFAVTAVDDNVGSNYTATAPETGISNIGDTVSAVWTVDEHKGYWVEFLDGPLIGKMAMVYSNTADTLVFSKDQSESPAAGSQFRIVRPTTTINADTTYGIFSVFGCVGDGSIYFQNLFLTGSKVGLSAYNNLSRVYATQIIQPTGREWSYRKTFGGGNAVSVIQYNNGVYTFTLNEIGVSLLTATFSMRAATELRLSNSVLTLIAAVNCTLFHRGGNRIAKAIYETCADYDAQGSDFMFKYAGYRENLFGGSSGPAIKFVGSTVRINAGSLTVSDSGSHGIEAQSSFLKIEGVITGTGNAGAGVYAHSGSVVHIKDGSPPTLTGTVGDLAVSDPAVEEETWANIDGGAAVAVLTEMTMAKKV